MSITVFLAIIAAAMLHAVWNSLVKGGRNKHLAVTAVVVGSFALVAAFFLKEKRDIGKVISTMVTLVGAVLLKVSRG